MGNAALTHPTVWVVGGKAERVPPCRPRVTRRVRLTARLALAERAALFRRA
jgi:hypothetical protein